MAAKIGGFLGLLAGFIVWKMIGGIVGLLVAIFLVVPIASALFISLFSAMGGGGKGSQATVSATTRKNEEGGLLQKCGGCGSDQSSALEVARDKNNNRGYLCSSCKREYAPLLKPDSIRRFWMCGACGFRMLAGTKIDAEVDPQSKCPKCGADVNSSLVNLSNDRPVKSGIFGEPVK